ncbi:MAG: hypothetical protein EXQ71_10535 [Acidimicrobiia bacterium]|nr:hypothetical protein [Acidimicrobiia bacterium]
MFTTGSKTFLGIGAFSLLLAALYGWTTGGTGLGPVTAGYNGGVGDHLGYTLLVSFGLLSLFLGLVAVATRDAESDALAELAGMETAPAEAAPAGRAFEPAVGAFGAGLIVLGLVVSNVMFVVALFLLLAVLIEWMVLDWSDRATGDPAANRMIRNRLMAPLEIPIVGILIVGGAVGAFSRLLLTSSVLGAVAVAMGLGTVIFLVGILFATRPKLSPNLIAGVLVIMAIGVGVAGVGAASRGERVTEEPTNQDEGTGNKAFIPPGTNKSTTTTVPEGEG